MLARIIQSLMIIGLLLVYYPEEDLISSTFMALKRKLLVINVDEPLPAPCPAIYIFTVVMPNQFLALEEWFTTYNVINLNNFQHEEASYGLHFYYKLTKSSQNQEKNECSFTYLQCEHYFIEIDSNLAEGEMQIKKGYVKCFDLDCIKYMMNIAQQEAIKIEEKRIEYIKYINEQSSFYRPIEKLSCDPRDWVSLDLFPSDYKLGLWFPYCLIVFYPLFQQAKNAIKSLFYKYFIMKKEKENKIE